jgi:hypothetical protein
MANESKKVFNDLMENYVGLGESANTIVRQLRKISNPDSRRKIINELRNLENKWLELLDMADELTKST